jgi:hypothetical protein
MAMTTPYTNVWCWLATAISRPKREAAKVFDKVTVAIQQGFGIATILLDDDAADEFLKHSAAHSKGRESYIAGDKN